EPRLVLLFFFQAEDGIRDFHVTGVQTCALPISGGDPTPPSSPTTDPAPSPPTPLPTLPTDAPTAPPSGELPPEVDAAVADLAQRSEERRVGEGVGRGGRGTAGEDHGDGETGS